MSGAWHLPSRIRPCRPVASPHRRPLDVSPWQRIICLDGAALLPGRGRDGHVRCLAPDMVGYDIHCPGSNPDMAELDAAGELASRCVIYGLVPVVVLVAKSGRRWIDGLARPGIASG